MAKLRSTRINQMVLLAVCVGSAVFGFALGNNKTVTSKASQPLLVWQSDEKVIERYERPGEPFEFGNLAVKRTKIGLRQKFSARSISENGGGQVEDWLESLEFDLKNKSDKKINFIRLQLQFPETEANGLLMAYNLRLGINPQSSVNELKTGKPIDLAPGDTVTFTLSAEELKLLKQFLALRNFQLADLNKVLIRIISVDFNDGMKWEQDYYYRPNPSVPGGYERIKQIDQ